MCAKRAVIFANGETGDLERLRAFLRPDDTLIAADGGLRHLQRLGLAPVALVGDLDSVSVEDAAEAQRQGAQILRHPPAKDNTDLELALQFALDEGFTCIRLAGMLGGRVDHLLGNLFLLALPALEGLDVRIEEGSQEIFVIRAQGFIDGRAGERVSLLALHGAAHGVTTAGLEYPLRGETLWPYGSRGISNVMNAARAEVRVEQGQILCIHYRDVTFK